MDVGSESPGSGRFSPLPAIGLAPFLRAPTWLISGGLHLLLVLAWATWLTPPPLRGTAADGDRPVGLVSLPRPGDSSARAGLDLDAPAQDSAPETNDPNEVDTRPAEAPPQQSPLLDTPPVNVELPDLVPDRLGPGPARPRQRSAPASSAADLARPSVRQPGTGSPDGGGGSGEIQFFGQGLPGRRFVYLLDASASMQEHGAIRVAKAELQASLAPMSESQQFQIIFYNEQLFPMTSRSERNSLFAANETNRNLASQHIRAIQPSGATDHKTALLEALRLKPDVLFFLTDAGEPWLDARDLQEVRRRNGGGTRICVVEFGKGPALSSQETSWTHRLARENNGTYEYQNVRNFQTAR
ncbi:MAG: hypothetical protein ACKO3P_04580 [Planctomycetaceae bacterium]